MIRTKDRNSKKDFKNLVKELDAIIANSGSSIVNENVSKLTLGLESLSDNEFDLYTKSDTELKRLLRNSPHFNEQILSKTDDPWLQELSLESAAYVLLAGKTGGEYYCKNVSNPDPIGNGIDGRVIMPMDGGDTTYNIESFEPASLAKYSASTAAANAQTSIIGGFEDLWFSPYLVPAGQNGVDLTITIPKVHAMTPRTNDTTGSAPYTYQIQKTSIIEAILNPSILESNATAIVPDVSAAPGWAVPNATITKWTSTVQGQQVTTGPILFNTGLDLIGASNVAAILGPNSVLDETDQLDPVMNVGTVYYKLSVNHGTSGSPLWYNVVLAADISNQPQSLLTQVQQGLPQQYQTTGTFVVQINQNLTPVPSATYNDSASNVAGTLESLLGLSAGASFNVLLNLRLSATGNTDTANFEVDVTSNPFSIVGAYDGNGNALASVSALTSSFVTLTPLGVYPKARRTNSNLRNNGTIVDSNTPVLYRYAVPLSAPIISQTPIGAATTITLEALAKVAKLRQNGRAVTALQNAETIIMNYNNLPGDLLSSVTGLPSNIPMAGAQFVTPSYLYSSIDVGTLVSNLQSKDTIDNIRGALTAAISLMVNELVLTSHYCAALELIGENPTDFEIILATDQQAYPFFMESGDVRSFGDKRSYQTSVSNNQFFTATGVNGPVSKVYFTFKRKTKSDDLHPLDFGRMLQTPSITYDVQINRNARTVNEIHMIPRIAAYVFLPILGRLDIQNLSSSFVSSNIAQEYNALN